MPFMRVTINYKNDSKLTRNQVLQIATARKLEVYTKMGDNNFQSIHVMDNPRTVENLVDALATVQGILVNVVDS